jgi:excisionase family DNA binding protein
MFDLLAALEQRERLMDTREVADLLTVSPRTVQRMVREPDFPSLLIGGQRMFDPSQLHRYFVRKNPTLARNHRKVSV